MNMTKVMVRAIAPVSREMPIICLFRFSWPIMTLYFIGGAYDPDCDDAIQPANTYNCNPGEVCMKDGTCLAWTCDIDNYNAADGCHCGCKE